MLTVNSNVQATNAYVNLNKTQNAMSSSLAKLSSGLRINKAADDAAGLAISESLKAQIGGLQQATSNAQDAINLVQTADGALAQTQAILQRLSVLTVQASNGTQSTTSLSSIKTEATQLVNELDRIANSTTFNGINLLDGSKLGAGTSGLTFQVGYSSTSGGLSNTQITVNAGTSVGFTSTSLLGASVGGANGTLLTDLNAGGASASADISVINTALNTVSTARATLGAVQNRFQYAIDNNNTAVTNLQSAESQVTDTDMASEMVNYTRNQILSQAGTTMLAQAKNLPSSILDLLKS